jgi:hypothetical protein
MWGKCIYHVTLQSGWSLDRSEHRDERAWAEEREERMQGERRQDGKKVDMAQRLTEESSQHRAESSCREKPAGAQDTASGEERVESTKHQLETTKRQKSAHKIKKYNTRFNMGKHSEMLYSIPKHNSRFFEERNFYSLTLSQSLTLAPLLVDTLKSFRMFLIVALVIFFTGSLHSCPRSISSHPRRLLY